jgi:hypothetical protein
MAGAYVALVQPAASISAAFPHTNSRVLVAGADVTRSCSTLANAHGSSSGRCQEAFAHRPNQQQYSGGDRTNIEAASQHAASELHERLAALWGMPSELLFERQQTVARMLDPADCGTPAQALWVSHLCSAAYPHYSAKRSLLSSKVLKHAVLGWVWPIDCGCSNAAAGPPLSRAHWLSTATSTCTCSITLPLPI